jgi:ABC-type lipoprotein release transport system permease subunit
MGRALGSWLWQVSPADPWSLAGALAALAVAASLAVWLPARRAARVDPVTVLRDE